MSITELGGMESLQQLAGVTLQGGLDGEAVAELCTAGPSKGVRARPSDSNQLTFFMADSTEDEEEEQEVEEEEEEVEEPEETEDENEKNIGGEASMEEAGEGESGKEGEQFGKQRERELTDRYLAGQLSFRDFVQEINQEDEEEVGSEDDEEWRPPGKRGRSSGSGGRGNAGQLETPRYYGTKESIIGF